MGIGSDVQRGGREASFGRKYLLDAYTACPFQFGTLTIRPFRRRIWSAAVACCGIRTLTAGWARSSFATAMRFQIAFMSSRWVHFESHSRLDSDPGFGHSASRPMGGEGEFPTNKTWMKFFRFLLVLHIQVDWLDTFQQTGSRC